MRVPAPGAITAPDGDVIQNCIQNVSPNTAYYFGYRYTQDRPAGINCVVTWTRDPACTDGLSRFYVPSDSQSAKTSWASIADTATSDPGTVAAQVLCGITGNVNLDQFYLNTVLNGF